MTISEMHIAVKMGLDKTSALELPAFEPEEIDYWLNKAIWEFVKTRYSGNNLKGESFEQTEKRIRDINSLIKDTTFTNVVTGGSTDKPNSYTVELSSIIDFGDYPLLYILSGGEEVEIVYTENGEEITKRQPVTQCTIDTYDTHIADPYSEHVLYFGEAKPLRLFKGEKVELITDGNYSISKYFLRYLRQPATVSLSSDDDCDLPKHTHLEIADIAVRMMIENIESNRLQTFENQIIRNE
jgi:hypothetical protein